MNILDVKNGEFAALFGPTYAAWDVCLAAASALPCPSDEALALYQRCTGRQRWPLTAAWRLVLICGRGAGKSLIAGLLMVFRAAFFNYDSIRGPGEKITVAAFAPDRRQCRVLLRYIKGFFEASPRLKAMIVNETKESLELSNHVVIEVHTASLRTLRGYSFGQVVADEAAFLMTDEAGANVDKELFTAVQPGLSRVPGSMLVALSTPYARRGWLHDQHHRFFGKEDSHVLVWQAPSTVMNPTLDVRVIEEALAEDEPAARAEWFAEFRRDIESFVSRETVDACVIPDRRELPPVSDQRYVAFVDPSGGSQDSMTLAIAHHETHADVLDLVRERRPPFSPADVVAEFAATVKSYHLTSVSGDFYGGNWPGERFREHGIEYRVSSMPRSDLYRNLLPLLNSKQVELLDHPRLVAQLYNLERRTGRGGKESIDHAPGSHDDLINAAAGALVLAHGRAHAVVICGPGGEARPNEFAAVLR